MKGISCLQVLFVLIWMEQTLIWFSLQRGGTGNGWSNIKDNFAERFQVQMSVSSAPKYLHLQCRSSRPKVFCKNGVSRNFTKFTGKHLCQSFFFNKVVGLRPVTLLKKSSVTGVFL